MGALKEFFLEWQEQVATYQELQLPIEEQLRLAQAYLEGEYDDMEENHTIASRYYGYHDCE